MEPSATETPSTFAGLVNLFLQLIDQLVFLVFGVVFLFIIWKILAAWVVGGGEAEKREEGRRLVLIAVVVFVLMMVIWGIVNILQLTFFGSTS